MVDHLTPQVLALQGASTEPITIYIDSLGGAVACARQIRSLLFCPNLDGISCRVLTVATGVAASAAALLLSSGDYSLAYPDCTIHYHGTRLWGEDVTLARATELTKDLDEYDFRAALELAENRKDQFLIWCLSVAPELDLGQFLEMTSEKVSESARRVIREADRAIRYYKPLTEDILVGGAYSERRLLEQLIKSEDERREYSRAATGRPLILEVVEQFFVLQFHIESIRKLDKEPIYRQFIDQWLDQSDSNEVGSEIIEGRQRRFKRVREFWLFFFSLCRRLQQEENPLTSTDALHLGLIDEVIGLTGVPNTRLLVEYPRDVE